MMRPKLSTRFQLSCKIADRRLSRMAEVAEDINKRVFLSHGAVLSSRDLLARVVSRLIKSFPMGSCVNDP